MASYNGINGTPNNINHWLLTDVLKNQWHHEGFVVSDLGGVNSMVNGHFSRQLTFVDAVAESLAAGCDFSDREFMENIPAAVRADKLTEARLNDAVTRVLRTRMRDMTSGVEMFSRRAMEHVLSHGVEHVVMSATHLSPSTPDTGPRVPADSRPVKSSRHVAIV